MLLQTEIREAALPDLEKIAKCHHAAFPKALSTRLGKKVIRKMVEWYIVDPKRFLLWIEKNGQCVGYIGGMVSDGSQVHGSASGMIQYAFSEVVSALVVRPWLWFHPEIVSRYKLILKNIYFRIIRYNKSYQERKLNTPIVPHVGLVVVGVHPAFHGKGYGALLLDAFERKAIELGYNRMTLTVMKCNHQAIKSYKRNGWIVSEYKGKSLSMQKMISVNS